MSCSYVVSHTLWRLRQARKHCTYAFWRRECYYCYDTPVRGARENPPDNSLRIIRVSVFEITNNKNSGKKQIFVNSSGSPTQLQYTGLFFTIYEYEFLLLIVCCRFFVFRFVVCPCVGTSLLETRWWYCY